MTSITPLHLDEYRSLFPRGTRWSSLASSLHFSLADKNSSSQRDKSTYIDTPFARNHWRSSSTTPAGIRAQPTCTMSILACHVAAGPLYLEQPTATNIASTGLSRAQNHLSLHHFPASSSWHAWPDQPRAERPYPNGRPTWPGPVAQGDLITTPPPADLRCHNSTLPSSPNARLDDTV